MPMIEVDNLSKVYGTWPAISKVTFQVQKGEILGFLGPNGAGKTTTMRILTCFLSPTEGTARVGGFDIQENSIEVRRLIGYLPENVPLYREMTVRGYLHYCASLRDVPRRDREDRVDETIEKARLEEYSDHIIGKLSKGFRQRVGIAQALVHNPPVLILDEPTIGLDPGQIIQTRDLIKSLSKDHTIILSTHILAEVSMVCSNVAIINAGHIAAMDSLDNLTGKNIESIRIRMSLKRAPANAADRLRGINGVTRVSRDGRPGEQHDGSYLIDTRPQIDLREELATLAVKENWGLLEIRRSETTLEDVFLNITSRDQQRTEVSR